MKKLSMTAALLLLMPALASAQNAQHPYRGQGYAFFGLGTGTKYQLPLPLFEHIGFGGEGFLYKGLGFGAEAGYAHWGWGDAQAWIGSVDPSYHFRRHAARGGVDPFVLGGFTLFAPTSKGGGRGMPGGNFGGGVNLWLKEHAALRLEVRDHLNGNGTGLGNHYLSFRVGMTFR